MKQQQSPIKTPRTMNSNTGKKTMVSLLALAFVLISFGSQSQDRYAQTSASRISIAGTSTLHKWTMTSETPSCEAVFEANSQGEPVKLNSLTVSLPAESLKSGKSSMDKNAYNALKTDANKQIAFQLASARIEGTTIKCTGKLKIAGTTKEIDLETTYAILPGGSLQCKGSKKIMMTDYNIDPPSFMFGSVTTGNEVTISFDVTLAPGKTQSTILN